jgi:hypothetical protein
MNSGGRDGCPKERLSEINFKEASHMQPFITWTIAPATLVLTLLLAGEPGTAKPKVTPQDCEDGYRACSRGCEGVGPRCQASCDIDLVNCHKKAAGGSSQSNPKTENHVPRGGGVANAPQSPPKTKPPKTTRPPLDNEWHGPISPPKGAGSQPPLDNQWHGPTSPPKTTGPIFKSGGGKQ